MIRQIYIASSWKNQHAVQMLTAKLREAGYAVKSFIENNNRERTTDLAEDIVDFEKWVSTDSAKKVFEFDVQAAINSDLTIYVGSSGCDAWAEVGAAYASGRIVFGLRAKGEQIGLMRKMVSRWFNDYSDMLSAVQDVVLHKGGHC